MVLKIDLVGPAYPFRGGISSFTTLLFRALAERHPTNFYSVRRQYPRFLFPGASDRDESPSALREDRARPLLDALNPLSWIAVGARIARDRPDLLVLPWWSMFWAGPILAIAWITRLFSRRTNILFLCHNVLDHEKRPGGALLARAVLRRGDRFIVFSAAEKAELVRLVGPRPVAVARHPSYLSLGLNAAPRESARQKLRLVEEKILLFFGLVRPYKGLEILIEALPAVLERFDVRLIVAGEIWEDKAALLKRIADLGLAGRVTILDRYIEHGELPVLFGAADLLVLPYLAVTASGPLQMAQTFRVPVVASRLGSLAETVLEGKTGFLVPPGDPAALAEAVNAYFERGDPAAMADNIRARDGIFGWDRLVREIEEISLKTET